MVTARILVVDDDPAVLGLVSRALSRRGYEVHAVTSPLEALHRAHDTPCFDLVVSDVIMPEMCGPELVKRIGQLCPASAVVLMSGHIDSEALPDGAAFISKPFLTTDLYSVVEKMLEPPACASEELVRLPKDSSAERRANTRFPLTLEVRFAVSERRALVETGSGRTIDLSSSGLSFTADGPLLTGQLLEVSIDWPALRDGGVRIQLIISGVVVRTNGAATALGIQRYQFTTRRVGPEVVPPQESIG
ncbi:MAG: response regulator [Bryobacteraceae bacterium]